ncbi:MAG: hypothetical protein ACYCY2_07510 [Acidithiobacillus ferriphilus]|uniref:hypothetical protein n=1 Tax=Acidithiobacillus ferriphilus TaxID=1689834 RepID=UPI001C0632D6|nr:hypothetical protein [Acidithiobacillus ferriphilus]MBU2785024.1 hypothetical protein [Acidithiobacillus ferriphilus]MEB8473849.1 hypothetical protein [Acidithiobacillus ferriphilus]UEP58980.1 hypothetical protein K1Y48_11935 [Acidithiobacillus ferriphilus]
MLAPPIYFNNPNFANMHNPLFDAYVYFDTLKTIHGFLFPFLLSLLMMFTYRKPWTWEVTATLVTAMMIARSTDYIWRGRPPRWAIHGTDLRTVCGIVAPLWYMAFPKIWVALCK